MKRKRNLLPTVLTMLALGSAFPAGADVIEWVGDQSDCTWGGPGGDPPFGSFFDGGFWHNYVPPGEEDVALFGSGYDPQENQTRPHRVHFGDVCIDPVSGCSGDHVTSAGDALTSTLAIQSGVWTFDFSAAWDAGCGWPEGTDSGTYTVTNAVQVGQTMQHTGQPGSATLTVLNGPLVSGWGMLALDADTEGVVTVSGADASWAASGGILVGHHGHGGLIVENGAAVANGHYLLVAELAGSSGELHVTGPGSLVDVADHFVVGTGGNGLAIISGGATCVNSTGMPARIGQNDGAIGSVTVTGAGSSWSGMGQFRIGGWGFFDGDFARGTLDVLNGGWVECENAIIGDGNPNAVGSVVVQDTDSHLGASNFIWVGDEGRGTLQIQDAGAVTAGSLIVGRSFGSCGALEVSSGGSLETGEAVVGQHVATLDDARATIDGSNSNWSIAGHLHIGKAGAGMMSVKNGGTLQCTPETQARLGEDADAEGHVSVDGVDSVWDAPDSVYVGVNGRGFVSVTNGGTIAGGSQTVWIGQHNGADGEVWIMHEGSKWTGIGDLYIGGSDSAVDGFMMIMGGSVDCERAALGFGSEDVVGHLVIGGSDAQFIASEFIEVGWAGQGELAVGFGAIVEAPYVIVHSSGTVRGVSKLRGMLFSEGRVEPGDPAGVLTVEGDYEQTEGGTLSVEMRSTGHDRLAVTGHAHLDGTLEVTFLEGFEPQLGDVFTALTFASHSGSFAELDVPSLPGGLTLFPIVDDQSLKLVVAATGDFDGDGDTDLDDYNIVEGCLVGPDVTTPTPGCDPEDFANVDLEGEDGDVDLADFAVFQAAFSGSS